MISELIQVCILAVVQGIGEFLPISSSGHNAVINHLFERFGNPMSQNSTEFLKLNILLHFGTLLALLIVLPKRMRNLFSKNRRIYAILAVATLPALLLGLPMVLFFSDIQTCLPLISCCFFLTGLLLCAPRLTARVENSKTMADISWKDAVMIGLAQACALLPGISRLGITLIAGMLLCRLQREESAMFSLILSVPIIAVACLWQFAQLFIASDLQNTVSWTATIATLFTSHWHFFCAVSISCLVGVCVLIFFLHWIKRGQLWHAALWVFMMSIFTMCLSLSDI